VVSENEWDTKEGPGKSMKNVLYVLGVPKDTSRNEVTLNSTETDPIVLAVIELAFLWNTVSLDILSIKSVNSFRCAIYGPFCTEHLSPCVCV